LRIRELKTGLYFVLAVAGLILVAFLLSSGLLRLLKRQEPRNLALRQAIKGLFRPRSATRSIMVTLSAALAVIFSISLVERNLDASFIDSYPLDAPNLFLVDIQPDQKQAVAGLVGTGARFFPVIRGTVSAINERPIDPEEERRSRGDNLGREFNLTYYDKLLNDERISEGASLFRGDWTESQVSVLDIVVKMHEMRVGDRIRFKIQGMPITARISSIRTRSGSGLTPFFYFVFPPALLSDAPQSLFCAVRVPKDRIAQLQNHLVARYPNVSVINMEETVSVFGRLMGRLSTIVRFFTSFSIAAGILIIVSSIFATRYARIQEAVYFTILGARRRFVATVFAAESLVLGLASGGIAMVIAQAGSWAICQKGLDLEYHPYPATSLCLLLVTSVLVLAVGLGASLPILRHKPAGFLREQSDD